MQNEMAQLQQQLDQFEKAIAAQEGLRGVVPDVQVDAMQVPLQQKAAELRAAITVAGNVTDSNLIVGNQNRAVQSDIYIEQVTIGARSATSQTDWETHYLQTLLAECERVDLAAIDESYSLESLHKAGVIKVENVFTTLYLENQWRRATQTVAEAIQKPQKPEPEILEQIGQEELLPIQAVEAVAAMPRLVIVGRPGGGKSTLVNYLVVQLAKRRLGKKSIGFVDWPIKAHPLPVRIILRRFAAALPEEAKNGKAGLVWDYLAQSLRMSGCGEVFEQVKKTLTLEGGIIFFDGLDEVHESDEQHKRPLIKDTIAAFSSTLPKCQVVVTCREYAYRDAWRLPTDLFPVVLKLALFNLAQIKSFAHTWYRHVGPQKGWSQQKCELEAQALYEAVHSATHLHELAQYPLLLTLMAQVHGRDGYLPNDRADLYERAVTLLLTRWENHIVRDVTGGYRIEQGLILRLGIPQETLRVALERVAFNAHERQEESYTRETQPADVPKIELLEVLGKALGSYDKAQQVINYIQERAGLLQAVDHYTYRFPHRTFQEYLTASYLKRQDDFEGMICERVQRNLAWWREVFLLMAGTSRRTPSNICNLVDSLIGQRYPRQAEVTSEQAQNAQLAGQALIETNFLTAVEQERERRAGRFSDVYEGVQTWLVKALRSTGTLSAKERVAAGNVLGQLGDPRFRADKWYLPDEPLLGFVEVPAGPFMMGSINDSLKFVGSEIPQRKVNLPTYWIARYPVTVAQWQAFVKASGHKPDDHESLNGYANHPVMRVTWHEAIAYCEWLNDKLLKEADRRLIAALPESPRAFWNNLQRGKLKVGLPNEAEWEKAARGIYKLIYPWGKKADPERANCYETGIGARSPVGAFAHGTSPYGCEEMSGNVWEWTRRPYNSYHPYNNYPYTEKLKVHMTPRLLSPSRDSRSMRGGAFFHELQNARCATRLEDYSVDRLKSGGFRVVISSDF